MVIPNLCAVEKKQLTDDPAKIAAAREFVKLELANDINESLIRANIYLRAPKDIDPDKIKLIQKIYLEAKNKYEKEKPILSENISEKLLNEIVKRFTLAEIRYLVETVKYPVHKKYQDFLKSEEFIAIINQPMLKANEIVAGTKNQILVEKNNLPGLKKPTKK